MQQQQQQQQQERALLLLLLVDLQRCRLQRDYYCEGTHASVATLPLITGALLYLQQHTVQHDSPRTPAHHNEQLQQQIDNGCSTL